MTLTSLPNLAPILNLPQLLIGIIILFFILLFLKQLLKKEFCVLCVTTSFSWLTLSILHWLNLFDNLLFIALLMGGTIVGVFYLVEQKVKEELTLFRLPFLLSLILLGYALLDLNSPNTSIHWPPSILIIIVLWILFTLIYLYRKNATFKSTIQKMIGCCKKW